MVPRACVAAIFVMLFVCTPVIVMRAAMFPYLFESVERFPGADVVLIPGASVIHSVPSPVLALRADLAVALFKQDRAGKILVTGDGVARDYDEVTPVHNYLRTSEIPENAIMLDRAGFDTYSSMYRARNAYEVRSLVIVTQDFHLPRAVFLARTLGIDAYGIATAQGGTFFDYVREIAASWKALLDIALHRAPITPDSLESGSASIAVR